MTSAEWALTALGGSKPLRNGSIYLFDNKYFIQPFSNAVKVYYIATRQCIRVLPVGLKNVVCGKIDPISPNKAWFFRPDGSVCVVNWKERAQTDLWRDFSYPLLEGLSEVVDFRYNYTLKKYEVLAIKGKVSHRGSTHRKTLIRAEIDPDGTIETELLLELKKISHVAKSVNLKLIVFLCETSESLDCSLVTVELKSFRISHKSEFKFVKKNDILSLAISVSGAIAIGYSIGVIDILIEGQFKSLKWHVDAVLALSFTRDNNYLISGGREKVLVFWQLGTDKCQFLPRLKGIVSHIETNYLSSDLDSPEAKENDGNEYYSVILESDGVNKEFEILVVNLVDLTSRLSISGVKLETQSPLRNIKRELKKHDSEAKVSPLKHNYTLSSAALINSADNNIYLSANSEVQCYDASKNEQAASISIIPKILHGKVKAEQNIKDAKITALQFSVDGVWMATVDEYETPVIDNVLAKGEKLYSLKFWRKSTDPAAKHPWELVTKVVDPHGRNQRVSAILASPDSYHNGVCFLTLDAKGGARLWRPKLAQNPSWTLRKVAPAVVHDDTVVCGAWSRDSSVILVAVQCVVYKLSPYDFQDRTYLAAARQLVDGNGILSTQLVDNDKKLVVVSETGIAIYDVLNDNVVYQCQTLPFKLSALLVAFSRKSHVFCVGINAIVDGAPASVVVIFSAKGYPVAVAKHDQLLCYVEWLPEKDSFLYIDGDYEVGYIHEQGVLVSTNSEDGVDVVTEMVSLVKNATRPHDLDGDVEMEDLVSSQRLDSNTFGKILTADLENMRIEELFDVVVGCL